MRGLVDIRGPLIRPSATFSPRFARGEGHATATLRLLHSPVCLQFLDEPDECQCHFVQRMNHSDFEC